MAELVGWEVGSIGRTNTLVDMVLIEENDLTFAPQLCHCGGTVGAILEQLQTLSTGN
jgi:hypothetical protein